MNIIRRIREWFNNIRKHLECGAILCVDDYKTRCRFSYLAKLARCLTDIVVSEKWGYLDPREAENMRKACIEEAKKVEEECLELYRYCCGDDQA